MFYRTVSQDLHPPRSTQPDLAPGRTHRIRHGAWDAARHQGPRRGPYSPIIGTFASRVP